MAGIDRDNLTRADELNQQSLALAQQIQVAQDNATITSMTIMLP